MLDRQSLQSRRVPPSHTQTADNMQDYKQPQQQTGTFPALANMIHGGGGGGKSNFKSSVPITRQVSRPWPACIMIGVTVNPTQFSPGSHSSLCLLTNNVWHVSYCSGTPQPMTGVPGSCMKRSSTCCPICLVICFPVGGSKWRLTWEGLLPHGCKHSWPRAFISLSTAACECSFLIAMPAWLGTSFSLICCTGFLNCPSYAWRRKPCGPVSIQ